MASGRPVGTMFVEMDLDTSKFTRAQKRMYTEAKKASDYMEENWRRLGGKSAQHFDIMRQRATTAYNAIVTSAHTTASERIRAEKIYNERMKQIQMEQKQGRAAMFQQQREGWAATTRAILRYYAAFYVLKGAVTSFISAGRELFEVASSAAQTEKAFTEIAGSAAAAQKEMAFLRDTADKLGQNFWDLQSTYKGLLAASRATTLAGEETRDIFLAVTKASATLGLSADKMKLTLYAVEQMMSKGKISSEELRRQMGDNLPGAFSLAAEAMGMTTLELDKALKAGTVMAEEFLPKFAKALDEKYSGEVVASVAAMNKWNEAVHDMKVAIASDGFLESAARSLQNIAAAVKDPDFQNALKDIVEYFAQLAENISKSAQSFADLLSHKNNYKELVDLSKQGYLSPVKAAALTPKGAREWLENFYENQDLIMLNRQLDETQKIVDNLKAKNTNGLLAWVFGQDLDQDAKDLAFYELKLKAIRMQIYDLTNGNIPNLLDEGVTGAFERMFLGIDKTTKSYDVQEQTLEDYVDTIKNVTMTVDDYIDRMFAADVADSSFGAGVKSLDELLAGLGIRLDDVAKKRAELDRISTSGGGINSVLYKLDLYSDDIPEDLFELEEGFYDTAENISDTWEHTMENMADLTADVFSDMLKGTLDSWESYVDRMGDYFVDMASEKIASSLKDAFSGSGSGSSGGGGFSEGVDWGSVKQAGAYAAVAFVINKAIYLLTEWENGSMTKEEWRTVMRESAEYLLSGTALGLKEINYGLSDSLDFMKTAHAEDYEKLSGMLTALIDLKAAITQMNYDTVSAFEAALGGVWEGGLTFYGPTIIDKGDVTDQQISTIYRFMQDLHDTTKNVIQEAMGALGIEGSVPDIGWEDFYGMTNAAMQASDTIEELMSRLEGVVSNWANTMIEGAGLTDIVREAQRPFEDMMETITRLATTSVVEVEDASNAFLDIKKYLKDIVNPMGELAEELERVTSAVDEYIDSLDDSALSLERKIEIEQLESQAITQIVNDYVDSVNTAQREISNGFEDFKRSLLSSASNPVQSASFYASEFSNMLSNTASASDLQDLYSWFSGSYLPFMQTYTGGGVDYNTLFNTGLAQIENVASNLSTTDVNQDLADKIRDALIGSVLNVNVVENGQTIQVVIDGRVIADVVSEQALSNENL